VLFAPLQNSFKTYLKHLTNCRVKPQDQRRPLKPRTVSKIETHFLKSKPPKPYNADRLKTLSKLIQNLFKTLFKMLTNKIKTSWKAAPRNSASIVILTDF
jgi:hypothetical protein